MFFKRSSADGATARPAPSRTTLAEWDLSTVAAQVKALAPLVESRAAEPLLVRARLADLYRDLELEPIAAERFEELARPLDPEGWRRLALAVEAVDHPEIRSVLVPLSRVFPVADQVRVGFIGMALETDALSLAMIRQSDLRIEEYSRHLAARLRVTWRGEPPEVSRTRLEQLDYKRLLAEAEAAKMQADDRMAYLRQRQQEDQARNRRRGKV